MTCNPPPPGGGPLKVSRCDSGLTRHDNGPISSELVNNISAFLGSWNTTLCMLSVRDKKRRPFPVANTPRIDTRIQTTSSGCSPLSPAGRMKRRGTGAGQIIPRSERLASWAILKRVRLQAQLARCLYGRVVFQLSNFTRKETTKAATLDIQLALSALNFLI